MLIRTKLQRPPLQEELIPRRRLLDRLHAGANRKLILVSAQAGAGKTTLLVQWLGERTQPSAWLSLDAHDNDLMVFVSYLCAAIQSVIPEACEQALDLLNAPATPPSRIIMTTLVNELDARFGGRSPGIEADRLASDFILALDDYHNITEPAIHEFVSDLIAYLPQHFHLVLTSRMDPPLPLARLRSRKEMIELRTGDLRFSASEAEALLESTVGRELDTETVEFLDDRTEGWAVGLRLAAIAMRDSSDDRAFVERFRESTSPVILDYLVSEVLSKQAPVHQDFLLRTSILDRFNADLCDAMLGQAEDVIPTTPHPGLIPSRTILRETSAANLFLLPLDAEGRWFRYHPLFRDLLRHQLESQCGPHQIAALHSSASQWFAEHGLIEEALDHAFSAGDIDRAVGIVAHQRYTLMNQARWQRLARYLRRFPADTVSRQPELLMLKAWLLYHQGHGDRVPAALEELEVVLNEAGLPPGSVRHLRGEISALRSMFSYYGADVEATVANAQYAIRNTADEPWIVRILARLFLAGAVLMKGDLRGAYDTIYQAVDQESVYSNPFKATMLMSACFVHWVAADLQGLILTASQSLALCDDPHSAEIAGYAHYHLGCGHYQRNDLAAAQSHFSVVVQRPYRNYGEAFADSAFGLSMTYQAQGRPDDARELAAMVIAHMAETGNTTLLHEAQAFQAELALRQGQLAAADQWLAQFGSAPPAAPITRIYRANLTPVKIWMAANTLASRRQAAARLDQLEKYTALAHNTVASIEVLALQALLHALEGDEPGALALLEKALALAQPGGFVRLFVDLGAPMARLLHGFRSQRVSVTYVGQILAAFPASMIDEERWPASSGRQDSSAPGELLTPRELEVLALLAERLTNKEMAAELVVSPDTIKSHTLSIYAKLGVHGRRQAANKAYELGLLPSS